MGEETQGFHRLSTCAARKTWYDLTEGKLTRIASSKMIDTTWYTFLGTTATNYNNVLYEIHCKVIQPVSLVVSMNSIVCQLFVNLEGRVNFGGGMLEVAKYELDSLLIPDPRNLPKLDENVFAAPDWDTLKWSPGRRQIDDAVFSALGLTAGEREAVYEGVNDLVNNRSRRARSV